MRCPGHDWGGELGGQVPRRPLAQARGDAVEVLADEDALAVLLDDHGRARHAEGEVELGEEREQAPLALDVAHDAVALRQEGAERALPTALRGDEGGERADREALAVVAHLVDLDAAQAELRARRAHRLGGAGAVGGGAAAAAGHGAESTAASRAPGERSPGRGPGRAGTPSSARSGGCLPAQHCMGR
jgi:hypothetical protein